jgi:hypothetical protein
MSTGFEFLDKRSDIRVGVRPRSTCYVICIDVPTLSASAIAFAVSVIL